MFDPKRIFRKLFYLTLFLLFANLAKAQNITRAEYFIDNDPGFGNASAIAVTPGTDITSSFQINLSAQTTGFHNLFVRAYVPPYTVASQTMGGWSLVQKSQFYKETFSNETVNLPNIVAGEYFVDTDPGFGNGTAISFTQSNNVTNIALSINVGAYTNGFHNLFARFRDADGKWSLTQLRSFYKDDVTPTAATLPNIVKGEYFIDTDPGFGNGTNIPVTPGTNLTNVTFDFSLNALEKGFHDLFVRFKDADDKWSISNHHTFYKETIVSGSTSLPNIVKGEYFFDFDPGFGNGNNIPLTPGSNLTNLTFQVNNSTLKSGFHNLFTRFRDANGNWSISNYRPFYMDSIVLGGAVLPDIIKVEYFVDADPGFGNGTPVSFAQSANVNNLVFNLDMSKISIGNHQVYVRALDANGKWSITNTGSFKIDASTDVRVVIGTVATNLCAGTIVKVPFTVTNLFGSNNIFRAQLSNSSGSFSNPVNIGSLTGNTADTISATIPSNTPAGTAYRIRIIATSPFDTSAANGSDIKITRVPEQYFYPSGNNPVCTSTQGYVITGSAGVGAKYTWQLSGGGTVTDTTGGIASANVNWTTAGLFTLTATASNFCGNGYVNNIQVRVYTNTPLLKPTISESGSYLYATGPTGTEPVAGYQWYKEGVLVSGATNSYYFPSTNYGNYTVAFTTPCGIGPVSGVYIYSNRKNQSITFQPQPTLTFGTPYYLIQASTTSALPIVYSIQYGPGTIVGDTLFINGAGVISVRAFQAGNSEWYEASQFANFTIGKGNSTISLTNLLQPYTGTQRVVGVTTNPPSLSVTTTYNGSTAAPVNGGKYEVIATINNSNYSGTVTDTLVVTKINQTITLGAISEKTAGDPAFSVSAAASSGLPVTYSIVTVPGAGVATISGNQISVTGVGQVTVTATQPGNQNYNSISTSASFNVKAPVAKDIQVVQIVTPANSCVLSEAEPLVIKLLNAGTETATNFNVSYKVDNGVLVTQLFNGSIAPGNSQNFTFTQSMDLSAFKPYQLVIYSALTGDERKQNDTLRSAITHYTPTAKGTSPDISICNGAQATISSFGGITYLWNTSATTSVIKVSPTTSTTYKVDITDANGCKQTDSVRITVFPALTVPVISTVKNNVCFGDSVLLTTNIAGKVQWFRRINNEELKLDSTVSYSAKVAGSYFVRYANANGCTAQSQLFEVNIFPKPTISAKPAASL